MKKRFEELIFIAHREISALSRNYLQECALGLQLVQYESPHFQTSELYPLKYTNKINVRRHERKYTLIKMLNKMNFHHLYFK